MLKEFKPMRRTEKRRESLVSRVDALERRIHALEAKMKLIQSGAGAAETLKREFPMGLKKSEAVEWLKVSRATVYAMIRDGRLDVNNAGKVTAESIVNLMETREMEDKQHGAIHTGGL